MLERQRSMIYRFASRRVGPSNGDDVVCEVFAAAFIAATKGHEVSPSWLMAVTRNKVVDRWRFLERQRCLADAVGREEQRSGERIIDVAETVVPSEVCLILAEMPARYRRLLERRFFDGMSIGDLAAAEQTSYKAAESALGRAKTVFRERFSGGPLSVD